MNVKYGKNKRKAISPFHLRNRKAISPVLATVILIAITLIAAIAIAGFVFGLFGSFTSNAQVSVTGVIVHAAATPWMSGSIYATNTGTSNTQVNGVSITYGGVSLPASHRRAGPRDRWGRSATVTLSGAGTCTIATTAGEAFSGSLAQHLTAHQSHSQGHSRRKE